MKINAIITGATGMVGGGVLTEAPPVKNNNSDLEYLLPHQFVKGYLNHLTGVIITNPYFNPGYSSPGFKANVEKLKSSI